MSETLIPPQVQDYTEARGRMVDSQVRPNKVIDPRIIMAMRHLPRERFVPPALASQAYADEDVPLPGGRCLMEPMVIARLVQGLRVRQNETALVVGSGSGYGSALLAACGARVIALEDDVSLLALARGILPSLAPTVTMITGPLTAGWAAAAPYDVILVEGAVPAIPDALVEQLKPEGRLATVLAAPSLASLGGPGKGVIGEAVHVGDIMRLRSRPFFECATPMLPQFAGRPAFTF